MDVRRRPDPARRIRETARQLAAEAGFAPGSAEDGAKHFRPGPSSGASVTPRHVGESAAAACQLTAVSVKTPKFNGKTAWEVFIAQFELLADAAGWDAKHRALQLALCLTEDAASCLLLLSRGERGDYGALVGALQRRFGQYGQSALLRSEFHNRRRRPGEPLPVLANDIEYMCKRAYNTMPPAVQVELARDQFLQALNPAELRIHTLLARPTTMNEALELAVEREMLSREVGVPEDPPVVRVVSVPGGQAGGPGGRRESGQAAALPMGPSHTRPRRRTQNCWGCGQPGHLLLQCPRFATQQGNDQGPV